MMQAPVQEGGSGWSTQGTPDAEQDVLVKGAVKLEKALKVLQAQAHLPLCQAQPQAAG